MRIAYLLGRFPVGSETFVSGELAEVERLGVEVGIYALDRGEERAEAQAAGLAAERHVLAAQSRARVLAGIVRFTLREPVRFVRGLAASLREGGFAEARAFLRLLPWAVDPWLASADALHAHFATLPTRAAHLLSRATGIPFGFTAHALDIFPPGADLPRRIRDASWIVTVCEYNRRELEAALGGLPAERVHLIPCGVDAERFRRRAPYRDRPLVVLAVGRLVEKKGFVDLVRAAARAVERGVELELRIVGEGPERVRLAGEIERAGLGERVRLLGALPHERIVEEIEAATLLVQPSVIARDGDRDSMPVVLKEAMSLEVPVVGTTVAGLPEAVDREVGWLVPPADAEALARCLEEVAGLERRELEERGRHGRARVLERFRLDAGAARLVEVLREARRG